MNIGKSIAVAVMVCGGMSAFAGGPWYVAKEDANASDTPCEGRGTEVLPYRTIQAALDSESFEAGDTVYVKRGDYDEGERPITSKTTPSTNRVHITRKVILKSLDGKDVTRIVGKWGTTVAGSTSGAGTDAIRCVCVDSAAAGTVLEGFTILNGCCLQNNNNENRCGSGVYSRAGKTVYAVDCDFINCSGTYGGGIYGGTAIRCRFKNCQAGGSGAAAKSTYLFACVFEDIWHSSSSARYVIHDGCVALNCTLVHNKAPGMDATSSAYNCLFARNDYDNSSGVQDIVGETTVASNCTTTAEEVTYPDQVIGLARGDFCPISGTIAVGLGKSVHTNVLTKLGVPATYLKYDFYGNEIDWSGGTVNAGAVQTVKTPRSDVAKVVFKEKAVVDGYEAGPGAWIYPDSYPVQYLVRPVVATGKTFYHYAPTAGNPIYLQTNGEVRVTPPLSSVTATQTYAQKTAAAIIWAEPSKDGTDIDQGDGTEANPYKTLQAAMNAVTEAYTIIYAKEGEYRYGGAVVYDVTNRVKFVTQKYVSMYISIRPAPAADGPVVICGASDLESSDGCGPGAVRCVYCSPCGSILNVTLSCGRTRADDCDNPSGTNDGHKHGAAVYCNTTESGFAMCDCTITNCVGRGSLFHRTTLNRCRVVDCAAPILMNRGIVATSLVAGNRLGCYPNNSSTLFQSTFSGNTMLTGESEFVAWYKADAAYNCVMVDPITAIRSKTDALTAVGNWVWGNTGGTSSLTEYCTHADPVLADSAAGDYRIVVVSPAIGHGMALAQLWNSYYKFAGSDIAYGPMLVSADGTLTPGCYQTHLPSLVELPAAGTGLVYEGAKAGRNVIEEGEMLEVTVKGDETATRWTPGFVANGVTNLFTAWPGSAAVSFPYSVAAQTLTALPKSTQWYADTNNVSGVANGFTPATAKPTLAGLFTDCDVQSGDTVNVAPGRYDSGTMKQSDAAAVLARAVVPAGVTLKATSDCVEDTVIVGDVAPEATRETDGCGTNAVRCLFMRANSKVSGFTLTGGRALSKIDSMTKEVDSYGGGVRCADNTAFVCDCVISNNAAYRGGGSYFGSYVNCRFFKNRGLDENMSGSGKGNYYYCIVANNRGGIGLMYPNYVYGCTLGPDNLSLNGKKRQADIYFWSGSSASEVKVFNSLIYYASNNDYYYANCAFSDENSTLNSAYIGEGSFIAAKGSLALDADFRPLKGNPVIDAGASAYLTAYLPAMDIGGVPRILNDGKIDIGAMEYDWRIEYGRLMGGGVKVTEVTSNVVNAAGGVVVPDGGLAASWQSVRSTQLSFLTQVTGEGSLSVKTNGVEVATVTAADGEREFEWHSFDDSVDLAFDYTGAGSAYLSKFHRLRGTMLLIR